MKRKMLVLDLDGTLTNSKKEITPRTQECLRKMQEQGHVVVLASGRPTPGMRGVVDTLHMKERGGYLLSYNGARIANAKTGEVVCQIQLPTQYLPQLHSFAVENGIGLISYEDDCIITDRPHDEFMQLEAWINQIPIKDVENFVQYVDFPINKCLMTAPHDRAPALERELAAKFVGKMSIYRSEPHFIEIMPLQVDKAASLKRLLDHLHMDVSDVIACGDGYNDISMLRFAGMGVAMANAYDAVKAEADYITLSNDEDGVAHVIEKFILNGDA